MKKINLAIAISIFSFLITSCGKDYIVGGEKEDIHQYEGTSTFDVLKLSADYDTLVQIIETANLVDDINKSNTTFFAPSDYTILRYLRARTLFVQAKYDASAIFGLDSLKYYIQNNINNTRDSLKLYLINEALPYSQLTTTGALYNTELSNAEAVVSYEYTRAVELGYSGIVSSVPRLVYYTFLWYPYDLSDLNPAADIPDNIGVRTMVVQSGLTTKNGIINKLEPVHTLFFYNTKK